MTSIYHETTTGLVEEAVEECAAPRSLAETLEQGASLSPDRCRILRTLENALPDKTLRAA